MEKGTVKRSVFNIIRCLLFSLIASIVLILILSIVAKYTDIDEKTISAINQVIKVVALLLGIFIGFKGQKGGFMVGAIVGLLHTLITFAVFSLISGELDFGDVTFYDFLIGIGVGAVSGILTVNLKGLKKNKGKKSFQRA